MAEPVYILGASVAQSTSQSDLKQTYGVFAQEALALDKDYAPQTVHTNSWQAPWGAWKALFPNITVIFCFLHTFLKIRDQATKALDTVFEQGQERVWKAYHTPGKRASSQRLWHLKAWAETALPESAMKTHTLDLCDKRTQFSRHYDYRYAHRTSNMVDRLMKFLDRACCNGQCFHHAFFRAVLSVPW